MPSWVSWWKIPRAKLNHEGHGGHEGWEPRIAGMGLRALSVRPSASGDGRTERVPSTEIRGIHVIRG